MRAVTENGDAKVCDTSIGGASGVSANGSASSSTPNGSTRVVDAFGGATVVDEFGLARLVSEYGDVKVIEIPREKSGGCKWFLILVSGLVIGMALLVPAGLLMLPAMGVAATGTVTTMAATLVAAAPVACEIAAGVLIGAGTSAIMYPLMGGDDWEEFGTSILCGAIEGGVTAGLGGGPTASVLRQAQVAAAARCVTQMTDNMIHGRPVMDNVLESSLSAAITAGIIAHDQVLRQVHIGGVLASDVQIAGEVALRFLRDVAVGAMASAITNTTKNVLNGENIFANIGDAMRSGAVSGAIHGGFNATLHTATRVNQRAAAIRDLERIRAQILSDGPGGLRELTMYCAAKDKNARLYDAEGNFLAKIGNSSDPEAIYLRYEPGDEIGHYERLCPSTLEPLQDIIRTGTQTCLADALGITPAELAACLTIENARNVYGDMTLVEVNEFAAELIGGGKVKPQAKDTKGPKISHVWEDIGDGVLTVMTPANKKFALFKAKDFSQLHEIVVQVPDIIATFEQTSRQPLNWARTEASVDDTICHFVRDPKSSRTLLVPGKKGFKQGFRLDTQPMSNGVSLYQYQLNQPGISTFASVTAPTVFGNNNPNTILLALRLSFEQHSVVYIADRMTAPTVEAGNRGVFPTKAPK